MPAEPPPNPIVTRTAYDYYETCKTLFSHMESPNIKQETYNRRAYIFYKYIENTGQYWLPELDNYRDSIIFECHKILQIFEVVNHLALAGLNEAERADFRDSLTRIINRWEA